MNYDKYSSADIKKYSKKNKKQRIKLVLLLGAAAIILLLVASIQRGYAGDATFIERLSITISKAIAYFVTPTMAFFKVLDMNVAYSFGTKTFNVILKLLGYDFETFGAIDVGMEDSTVYTMSGMFYADFGIIGGIVLTVMFLALVDIFYRMTIKKFSFSRITWFVSLNTILLMSFFTWMGRISFFWLFPVFVTLYEKIFIKQK